MTNTIRPDPFYNRAAELRAVDRAWRLHDGVGGQMLLMYGRRRVGKTYLLQRYLSGGVSGDETPRRHCYYLAEQTTAAAQRAALARQVLAALPADSVATEEIAVTWNALLRYVSRHAKALPPALGRFGLILDEFQYLVAQTPELPSIIQSWWDQEGVHASVLLVLCGSQLSAMQALGKETAPLFGRCTTLALEPLHYYDVACFYEHRPHYGIPEALLMYGVLGGTPRYHALVDAANPPADEIVTLLMQPHAVLENEVRFLLGSEHIRDPAPYNAVLAAVASGETQFGRIQQAIGVERGTLSFYLRTLEELRWIRHERPFGERSDRRALYRVADPFLAFWYRFVAPLSSALQFSDPRQVYDEHVAPYLADYMGLSVFEDICAQWLARYAQERLGLSLVSMGRYWSRDGSLEIDIMGELSTGRHLVAECKWRADSVMALEDYLDLRTKATRLPEARWRDTPTFVLFAVGGFEEQLRRLAEQAGQRLILVSGADLLAGWVR